ncbi:glycosyl transferase family 2 [Thiolapillus brandeum]|uniref:Glycosyl transferase family 2 n=2 Tax=Thiolapillus brandeum TaxID=1076588 RepID=A0A7U6GIK6_9GAMM|nr:glycosyl transferase family 2 [Thiolapillus brandeum]
MKDRAKIAVVIPTYKVKDHILGVIDGIPGFVWRIYVVDDACPLHSGKYVDNMTDDARIRVIYHDANQGVGGAVMTGYRAAIDDEADIIVKIDGDGQMPPGLIPYFVEPILSGDADYTKGNRFYDLEEIRTMPPLRLFGNAILSFMTKLSSGYWNLFDPTNGYTAIHVDVAKHLPFNKISNRYFFETDMLFRLNTLRAVVLDIPMEAKYGDENSSLRISHIVFEFFMKHIRNTFKRIFYNYYLRDLSLASIELPVGLVMLVFGVIFGGYHWIDSSRSGVPTPAGTVMLAAMPILMGLQLILSFIGYDVSSVPSKPLHRRLKLIDSE